MLRNAHPFPKNTYPGVVIVTKEISVVAKSEKEARRDFLWMMREETTKDFFEQILAIDIIALSPNRTMSVNACHRRLKERLIDRSDHA